MSGCAAHPARKMGPRYPLSSLRREIVPSRGAGLAFGHLRMRDESVS
jgi:hypothetical protein